jgi:hypothetical protein
MSGIYQLNQATGSVTLPISGNTFIGTSDNSELYTVDSAGNVTIYGTGSGGGSIDTGSLLTTASVSSNTITFTKGDGSTFPILVDTGSATSIDTGSFATTGSNTFSGSQNIIGDVTSSGIFYSQQLRVVSGSSAIFGIGSEDAAIIYISSSNANYSSNAIVTPNPIVLQTSHDIVPSPNTKAGAILLNSYNYNDNKTAQTQLATVNMATNNHDSAFTIMLRNGVGNRNEVLRLLSDGSTIMSGSLVVDSTLPGLSDKGVQVTGSLNTTHTSGLLSQGIVDIIDEDLSSVFPAYNIASGSVNGFSLNSGSNSPAIFMGTVNYTNINGITGSILNGAAISFSSGSTACSVGLQKTTGGTQSQLYYNPDYAGGNESYLVQVGDGGGENKLVIRKGDASGEGISLKASDITEGFVLDHSFSNSSASLFKVKDSGSVNTIFNITGTGTQAYRPLTGLSNDFTASVTGGGVYARISGSLTCSIQPNSVVPIPTGVEFEFFQYSNHQLHFDTGSGVILNSKNGNVKLTGQFSAAILKKVATDEWDLIGDLS